MKLGGRSSNVEDRRGLGVPLVAGGGVGGLIIALLIFFLRGTPGEIGESAGPGAVAGTDAEADFVSAVLKDTEQTWPSVFREQLNREYREPKVVLFSGLVQSACGWTQAASGPFYCPLDEKVYIDLSFYRDLKERFGAPGDAAQAYVIAHEVGHHVQKQLGISEQVMNARRQSGEREANDMSVRQELQADCFAGVWANRGHRERQILEAGDAEEALRAASAIGDDRMQKQAQGHVVPESFTHGSSAQRQRWFRRGLDTGDIRQCDTFDARDL